MDNPALQQENHQGSAARALILSLFFLAGSWWVTSGIAAGQFWQLLLALLFFMVPLSLFFQYQATVGRLLRRQQFHTDSLLFRLFSGRTLGLLIAIFTAGLASVFVLLELYFSAVSNWLVLLLSLPLFLLFTSYLQRRLAGQYRSFILPFAAMRLSRLLMSVLPALVSTTVIFSASGDSSLSLSELQARYQQPALLITGSDILQKLGLWMQGWDALGRYLMQGDGPYRLLCMLAVMAEQCMFYYLVFTVFSVLSLSGNELRRCFAPLTDATVVPPMRAGHLALVSACCSFVLVFILLPMAVYAELWVRQQRPLLDSAGELLTLRLEQIDDQWYRPGTGSALQSLRMQALGELNLSHQLISDELNLMFDAMAGNTDAFLDWYYSLGGEYARIAHMLTGDLETYLTGQFTDLMQQGSQSERLDRLVNDSLQQQEDIRLDFQRRALQLLADNRIEDVGGYQIERLASLDLSAIMTPPVSNELTSLQTRLLASSTGAAGAGLVSSVVAAKLTSRLLAKGSFKLAAKALGKLLASKAGGAAAGAGSGAAAGALAGSFFPGPGTALGALIGGIGGGLMAGVAIDKAILEFEEAVGREAFRADILQAIEEARQAMLQELEEQA